MLLWQAYFNPYNTWLKAVIIPIPKLSTNDPCIPLHYRGISLLSCVYKAFSCVLNNRLASYFEVLDWFVDEQIGFRKQRPCQDHLYTLTTLLEISNKTINQHLLLLSILRKLLVNCELLLYKLILNNVDGKRYKAIKTLYTNTSSAIKLNMYQTEWFVFTSGVRQGDILSITLFSVFINDLAHEIKSMNIGISIDNIQVAILLYVDDIIFLADNKVDLQKMLDKLNEWCEKWYMSVNLNKTKVLHFMNMRQKCTNVSFFLGDNSIEPVYRY